MATQRVAIYPGSFDPPTNGHLDIVDRAARLFDRVVIGVGRNLSKKTVFTYEERVALMEEACARLPNVEVRTFDSLQVEFARGSVRRSSSAGSARSQTLSSSSRWRT